MIVEFLVILKIVRQVHTIGSESYARATPKNVRVSACVGTPNELHQRSVCVHVCAIRGRKERERRQRERGRKE